MTELLTLKTHYRWTPLDEQNIKKLSRFAIDRTDEFVDRFYKVIHLFSGSEKFTSSQEEIDAHKQKLTDWYLQLFCGYYDDDYMRMICKIGADQVKIGLEPHYVSSAISFVREYLNEVIADSFQDRMTRDLVRVSTSKLLDMNLDMVTSSFRQEELKQFFEFGNIRKNIISSISKFSFVLDTTLLIILAFIAVVAIVFVIGEATTIFIEPYGANKAIVKILGDLLILWSVSELIQEGIKHTKGSKFAVRSFVAVGLAACIREILIASLGHQTDTILVLTATTLSLGVVYFLLSKSQSNI